MNVRLIAAVAALFVALAGFSGETQPAGLALIETYFRGVETGMEARKADPAQTKGVVAVQARRAFRAEHSSPQPASPSRSIDLVAYRGLASWVDIFDRGPWEDPIRAVKRMKRRGVQTLFLQTSIYGIFRPIFRRRQVSKFLRAAHRRNIKVVAWYVPSFKSVKFDLRRVRHAIGFKSRHGHRFDSFALDIESDVVDNIARRNRRLTTLSRMIRKDVGASYPLGAITPDPCCSLYWPRFPYKEVRRLFDVFVPMGYWTFRASGYNGTKRYTSRNIAIIRRETGDPEVPIHMIGGIADSAGKTDLKGFVSAIRRSGVIGASLYDFPITTKTGWKTMQSVPRSSSGE